MINRQVIGFIMPLIFGMLWVAMLYSAHACAADAYSANVYSANTYRANAYHNMQAPAGLDNALKNYYANRKPQHYFSAGHTAQLERDLLRCLPPSYRPIMRRIVRHESANNPFAININLGPKLSKQPASRIEAARIAKTYISQGYSVDLGYAQINSQHYASAEGFLNKAGYRMEDMFDPCTNLRAGALIPGEAFLRYGNINLALSVYNTGSPTKGLTNGYVNKVLKNR